MARGERVEVAHDPWNLYGCGSYTGFLRTGGGAGPLPAGSSLDEQRGTFRWQPPAEFAGTFEFVFVYQPCSGREMRIPLRVVIAK